VTEKELYGLSGKVVHGCPSCGYADIHGLYSAVPPNAWFWSADCSECQGEMDYCPHCGIRLPSGPRILCGSEADDEDSYRYQELEREYRKLESAARGLMKAAYPYRMNGVINKRIAALIVVLDGHPVKT